MANSLYPGFVRIFYHSVYAPHIMTIPTRALTTTGIGTPGTYEAWDASTIAADAMVENLMDLIGAAVDSGIELDAYTIYRVPTVGATPEPIYSASHPVTGSSGVTGWSKAVQATLVLRTAAFGLFKWVILDRTTNNAFGNFTSLGAPTQAVADEFMNPQSAWSGRDGSQPMVVKQMNVTINARLEREYHM